MSEVLSVKRTGQTLPDHYDIVWSGDFSGLADRIRDLQNHPAKICIVTDSNVKPIYLEAVLRSLNHSGMETYSYVIPAGESSKTLAEIEKIYDFLISNHFDRKDMLAALGGGVVGDMTGFAAATYLRGIDFIQIPTTLLSQTDSSVGGKTGVDFREYKNMVGAFWQPRLVYMNVNTLKTLPADQFSSGMAEVIKSALIRDKGLYEWIEENNKKIRSMNPDAMIHLIKSCCAIKAAVVEEDPRDTGLRAILNFGHTIGHAVEKLSRFRLSHGHSVGLGMISAAWLSMERGMITREEYERIRRTNEIFAIPLAAEEIKAEDILKATRNDKKMENGQIKFILLDGLGNAVIRPDITDEQLLAAAEVIRKPDGESSHDA